MFEPICMLLLPLLALIAASAGEEFPDKPLEAYAAAASYECTATSARGGAFRIEARIRMSSGFFDVASIDADSVVLNAESEPPAESQGLSPKQVQVADGVVWFSFASPPGTGFSQCPRSLVLSGTTGSMARTWRAEVQPRAVSDQEIRQESLELIRRFEDHPPQLVELGTPRLSPNPVTHEVIRRGTLALPALLEAFRSPSRLQIAHAVRCAGQLAGTSVRPALEELRARVEGSQPKQPLDYTILGEIDQALSQQNPR